MAKPTQPRPEAVTASQDWGSGNVLALPLDDFGWFGALHFRQKLEGLDLNFLPPAGATSSQVASATSCPQPFPGPILHQGGEANDRQRTGALRAFEMGWDMANQLDVCIDM